MVQASLLISTYNWPQALNACLQSVAAQSLLPSEVVICDDGSGEATRKIVEKWQQKLEIPVIHVWHEDEGFKLASIRNRGFAAARFPYLIQIDGDLILHKDFVKDHVQFAKPGSFTTGSRVLLSKEFSEELLANKNESMHVMFKKNNNLLNGLHLPFLQPILASRYKSNGKWLYYVKGCNMAFWKADILAVNGYNEAFTGWGREDSEIAIRLMNSGIKKRFLKFGGICYHIFHPEASRNMEEANTRMMQRSIDEKITRAKIGIDQYL